MFVQNSHSYKQRFFSTKWLKVYMASQSDRSEVVAEHVEGEGGVY